MLNEKLYGDFRITLIASLIVIIGAPLILVVIFIYKIAIIQNAIIESIGILTTEGIGWSRSFCRTLYYKLNSLRIQALSRFFSDFHLLKFRNHRPLSPSTPSLLFEPMTYYTAQELLIQALSKIFQESFSASLSFESLEDIPLVHPTKKHS